MKVLVQDMDTRLFYKPDGWTHCPDKATNFPSSLNALNFLETKSLGKVQIVLKFKQSEHDVVLPVFQIQKAVRKPASN